MTNARPRGISDAAMVVVIAALAGLGAFVWLWGGVAGALFGRGWAHVGPGQLLGVVLRLPGRLSNPALAWPAQVHSRLPGPGGFYGGLGLLVATGTAIAGVAARTRALRGLRSRDPGAR